MDNQRTNGYSTAVMDPTAYDNKAIDKQLTKLLAGNLGFNTSETGQAVFSPSGELLTANQQARAHFSAYISGENCVQRAIDAGIARVRYEKSKVGRLAILTFTA